MKAKGKCTTDHISPAGKWLTYRGHLENISDNMFSGAVNAFTGESGTGTDALSGAKNVSYAKIARHYKAEKLRWVAVGDENYGEGSSREHAAMSPRLLGARPCSCVVRAHPRDQPEEAGRAAARRSRTRPTTTASPRAIASASSGSRISRRACRCARCSTTPTARGGRFAVRHTLNAEQIAWFRAGSALNLLRSARD
jgi:aconitate hydratase